MAATAAHATPIAGAPATDAEHRVDAAERALAQHAPDEALAALEGLNLFPTSDMRLALRVALVKGSAALELGRVDDAVAVLEAVRPLADDPAATDVDRASLLFHLGCARLTAGFVGDAASLLTLSLDVCNRAAGPSDRLRALVLERRARCHRDHRDWAAARADIERALELAESVGDDALIAQASLQAAVVAEREGQWLLANFYAERARGLFAEVGDGVGVGKCLNNLGGLAFLLGKHDEARKLLRDSFRTLLDLDRDVEGAYAISSLAQVELRAGEAEDAERLARRALAFLGRRDDHRNELGNVQLVLGRALLEQGRLDEAEATFADAEQTLERAATGERAAVWIAQGDAATRRGDSQAAAALYRRAAASLQDFHF